MLFSLQMHMSFANNQKGQTFGTIVFLTTRGLGMEKQGLILIGFSLLLGYGQEINCNDDPDYFQNLSGAYVGRSAHENVLMLPCDTMIVPEGKSAVIKRNNYLTFLNNAPTNIILVYGTLTIEGSQRDFCTITNGLDSSNSLGYLYPTKNPWLGFYVSETGRLLIKNAILYGVRIPVRSENAQVELKNVTFENPDFMLFKNEFVVLFNGKQLIQHLGFSDTENALMHSGIQVLVLHDKFTQPANLGMNISKHNKSTLLVAGQ